MDKILEEINKVVAEKTFSLDALEVIKKLKDSYEQVSKDAQRYLTERDSARADRDENNRQLIALKSKLEVAEKELAELRTEAQANATAYLERHIRLEVEADRRKDIFNLVSLIFKSPVVRHEIHGSKDIPYHGQYGMQTSRCSYDETVITKEEKQVP